MPKDKAAGTYAVGYKKPPVHTRFRQGASGNPAGRPKGSPNFRTALDRVLRERVTVNEGGQRTQVSKLEAMVKQHVNKAVGGDARAREQLLRVLPLVDESFSEIEPETVLDASDHAVVGHFLERIRTTQTNEVINDDNQDHESE